MKDNVRLLTIGNLDAMPYNCREAFNFVIEKTKHNSRLTLIILHIQNSSFCLSCGRILPKNTYGKLSKNFNHGKGDTGK
jgi:hypothetical protein